MLSLTAISVVPDAEQVGEALMEETPLHYTIISGQSPSEGVDSTASEGRNHRPEDMMVLRIENEIMTVYTRWLKKNSQLFKGIVESHQSAPNDQEHPLAVPDVTVAQFEALLDYIDNSTSSNFTMPATRWADLLAASHHLKIASIKQRVVREVFHNHRGSFRLTELLSFYEAYAVRRKDLRHIVRERIVCFGALSADELGEISHELSARIAGMREDYLHSLTWPFGALNAPKRADELANGWVKHGLNWG